MNVCQEYQVWSLYDFNITATVVKKQKRFDVLAVKIFKNSHSNFSLLACKCLSGENCFEQNIVAESERYTAHFL
jgi:hypothetical protein